MGRRVLLDDVSHRIVGVLPASFEFLGRDVDLWRAIVLTDEKFRTRSSHFLRVVARLRGGVRVEQALAEMDRVGALLEEEYPDSNRGHGAHVTTMREFLERDLRPALSVLLAASALLLLVGCANVANLLLARGSTRARELGIRSSLGAGRARLLVQLLAESLVLSLVAGLVGVLLSLWIVAELPRLLPPDALGGRSDRLTLDFFVLGFALGASVATCVLSGLAPALVLTRWQPLAESLRGTRGGHGRRARILRNSAVVSEAALTLILLAGAALLSTSFLSLRRVPSGFRAEGVLTMRLSLPRSRYDDVSVVNFFAELLPRLRALPGTESVGAVSFLPLGGDDWRTGVEVESRAEESDEPTRAHLRFATPGFLETIGVSLLAGRHIDARDRAGAAPVVVVNETMARRYWPKGTPVGRRVRLVGDDEPWRVVAGVVGDVKYWGLDGEANPEMFLPHSQHPFRSMAVALRSSIDGDVAVLQVRSEVQRLDRNLPLSDVATLESLVDESVSSPRFQAVLLSSFAVAALLLACIGVYGVMSYTVAQQKHEIGVRIALGASRLEISRRVVTEGVGLVAIGVSIGLLGVIGLSPLLRGLLFQTSPTDPFPLAVAAAVMLVTGLLASHLASRRASRIDPNVALRDA